MRAIGRPRCVPLLIIELRSRLRERPADRRTGALSRGLQAPPDCSALEKRSGAGLEAGGPRWPACRGAACSHIILGCWSLPPADKSPRFQVYTSMVPDGCRHAWLAIDEEAAASRRRLTPISRDRRHCRNAAERFPRLRRPELSICYCCWRPRPELNRGTRFCRPLRNHSATWPLRSVDGGMKDRRLAASLASGYTGPSQGRQPFAARRAAGTM